MKASTILTDVKELLSVPEHWVPRPGDCKQTWCIINAVSDISCRLEANPDSDRVLEYISKAVKIDYCNLAFWNDNHSHTDVMLAIDKAIELAEAKGD